MKTLELLTMLKVANGGASDYRIAKILGIKPQTVSNWKTGRSTMGDEVGIRAARLLGLDEKQVLLDLQVERHEGDATFPVWKAIRDRLEMAAAPAVAALVGYGAGALDQVPFI